MIKGLIALILAVACQPVCFGQDQMELRVRTLDYITGKPVKGVRISMWPENQSYRSAVLRKTDAQGTATFRLSTPLPSSVTVMPDGWKDFPCTLTQRFAMYGILTDGVVGTVATRGVCERATAGDVQAHPGEVVIFVRRLSPWMRFRWFMHEAFNG